MTYTILDAAIGALKEAPTVNIKGKEYSQVATRVEIFRRFFGVEWRLLTRLEEAPDPLVRVVAEIISPDGALIATGMAEENRNVGPINKTSALENCETSAIGRCLANFGLHGGEYATAEEVDTAIKQQGRGDRDALKGGARRKREDYSSVGVTELKKQVREFDAAMQDCETIRDFEDLVATNQTMLDQVKADLPNWWHTAGDSDVLGIEDRIMQRRERLRARAEFEAQAPEPAAPIMPNANWTDDGLLAVPQEDGVVRWDIWGKQFLAHELNLCPDEAALKALGEKYKATFASLKAQDADLHKRMAASVKARKEQLAAKDNPDNLMAG